MKKLTIAFLYNVRHIYPDANDPRTQLETDFDDLSSIKQMTKHFQQANFQIIPIEANEKAYAKLFRLRSKIDLVFNYAEGIYGRDRECQMPAILEMLRLPYTGSSPLTQALVLDKHKTKEVVSFYGVPVLPDQLFVTGHENLRPELTFPLIVKPNSQGSSAGVTNKSVVKNKKELYCQIKWVIKTFNAPALVEQFVSGREFSVGLIGNPPQLLPVIEPDHQHLPSDYAPIDSLEVKWFLEEEASGDDHLMCPAKIDKELYQKVEKVCLTTWKALGLRDWCRMDLRCDKAGQPYLIEVNSPAGLIPPEISTTSYFPLAARRAGFDYQTLIKKIITISRKRYEKK